MIFGDKYPPHEIRTIMILVALGIFFEGYRFITEPILQGTDHYLATGLIELGRVGAFVVVGIPFGMWWSGVGIAAAICSVNAVAFALRLVLVHRWVVKVPWGVVCGVVVVAVGVAAAALFRQPLVYWPLAVVGIAGHTARFRRKELATITGVLRSFFRRG